ncbi:MAG TPA: hypothetical protein VGJ93_08690 [Desulfuromonadaceae bacterium]|jgi:Ni/Fe-hydrogenase subunit HybB-like protein
MSAAETKNKPFSLLTPVWISLVLLGGIFWVMSVNGQDSQRAWRLLLSNFIFFTSLSAGLVVWPAMVRACNGRWHQRLERVAAAGIAFSIPSILVLILLWIGSPHWSPWYGVTHHQGVWLNNSFLFGRDLAGLLLFWSLAARYLNERRSGMARVKGGFLILSYCLVFTLLGFDLVMALDPKWFSTMAGGYFFMSGLYIAISGWAFLATWQPDAGEDQRHDLGKLMVGFSLMTAYMMYSQLLPFWYGNLPEEVRFVIPRIRSHSWKVISYGLLGLVYLGPLVLLLLERAKRNRWALGSISFLILVGMWVERWWLVAPTFQRELTFGLLEIATLASFAGMMALGMEQFLRRVPQDFPSGEG